MSTESEYQKANIQTFLVGELQEAEYNARKITGEAYKALKKSLSEFGLIAHPVVNLVDGVPRIVGGHQRVKALMDAGVEKVDCVVVELNEAEEKTANFALNNRAIQGQFIPELTQVVLDQIEALSEDSYQSYADNLRLNEVLPPRIIKKLEKDVQSNQIHAGQTSDHYKASPMPDPPVSEIGKTYRLGEHQVYCGERTTTDDLRPFGFFGAKMTLTSFARAGGREYAHAIPHILQNTLGAVYIVVPWDSAVAYIKAFEEGGGDTESPIIAYSPSAVRVQGEGAYMILFGGEASTERRLYGASTQSNLWTLHRTPPEDDLPVELAVKCLLNGSQERDIVLDPCLGKGSVIVAAEKTGRTVVGYVSRPAMCDQIRKRWAEFVLGEGCDWQSHTGDK